jgi:hypothetical protein
MPSWVWVLIGIAAGAVGAAVVWQILMKRRTDRLRGQFGPEYDRVAEKADSRGDAEAELAAREERRRRLDIRPLSEAARTRYLEEWRSVQADFVDEPRGAVARADELIQAVMAERGYPVDDFEQRAADVSVDHPEVVENYRKGHRLAQSSAGGDGSTEDLRQAMRHYRALFSELLEADADRPIARDDAGDRAAADGRVDEPERTVRRP